MEKYAVARGWFKSLLHATYGFKWYKRMMSAKRCVINSNRR